MKPSFYTLLFITCLSFVITIPSKAQNTFPSTGNAGIGTTTPGSPLTIKTSGSTFGLEHNNGTVSVKTYVSSAIGQIGTYSNHPFQLMANNGLNQFVLLPNGNVGIGNATPAARLDVNGDALVNGIRFGRGAGNQVYNIAIGINALNGNSTGNSNTVIGSYALYNNHTGYSNIAIGTRALYNDTDISGLVAIGDSALFNTLSYGDSYDGIKNTAVGTKALFSNGVGAFNTAVGFNALYSNTLGSQNTALGTEALYSLRGVPGSTNYVTGNTATGYRALYTVKSVYNTDSGTANTATGAGALNYSTTGYSNTAIGFHALQQSTIASENTTAGMDAGYNITTGSQNTIVGTYTGFSLTTGSYNTLIGYNINLGNKALNNTTVLGNGAVATASNTIRVGNSSITSIGGYVSWTNISDGRVKKNIKQNVPGLSFINKLKPVTYNLDLESADKILSIAAARSSNGKSITVNTADRKTKESVLYTGFIAQDVEKAAKAISYDFSGVDAAKNSKDLYGLRYAEFVVPLVKAVQELSSANDTLNNKLATQQAEIDRLKEEMNGLKNLLTGGSQSRTSATLPTLSSAASLLQNVPNPASASTLIRYSLPSSYSAAQINITGSNGTVIKEYKLSGTGEGNITVSTASLSAGMYYYSLYLNGRLIDTKQMIVSQ